MELPRKAKEHFAQQHIDRAVRTVAAVEDVRAKEVDENQRAYERFYNNLALFSGGTVALSVTYLGYLKTLSVPVVHRYWLVGSWTAFFICLVCSLFWLFLHTHYSYYFRDRDYCEAVAKRYETEIAEFGQINAVNLQTATERERFIAPRKKAIEKSKENAEWNERRQRLYLRLWIWVGRLARCSFLVGFALLLAFAIRNT
jgi:hypothetical protein